MSYAAHLSEVSSVHVCISTQIFITKAAVGLERELQTAPACIAILWCVFVDPCTCISFFFPRLSQVSCLSRLVRDLVLGHRLEPSTELSCRSALLLVSGGGHVSLSLSFSWCFSLRVSLVLWSLRGAACLQSGGKAERDDGNVEKQGGDTLQEKTLTIGEATERTQDRWLVFFVILSLALSFRSVSR